MGPYFDTNGWEKLPATVTVEGRTYALKHSRGFFAPDESSAAFQSPNGLTVQIGWFDSGDYRGSIGIWADGIMVASNITAIEQIQNPRLAVLIDQAVKDLASANSNSI